MAGSDIFMLFLAAVVTAVAFFKGGALHIAGLKAAGDLFINVMPKMALAFIVAGMIQVLLPKEFISQWIGKGSGFKGLLIGAAAGTVTPGGPFTHFPIVAALYKAGADIGPIVAYLTAWSALGIHRVIVWELPLLGSKIAVTRFAASLVLPFIAAGLAKFIFARFN